VYHISDITRQALSVKHESGGWAGTLRNNVGDRKQGEGVSYGRDGLTLYASSEKKNAPLFMKIKTEVCDSRIADLTSYFSSFII
jgi:hypothetical protein